MILTQKAKQQIEKYCTSDCCNTQIQVMGEDSRWFMCVQCEKPCAAKTTKPITV